MGKSILLLGGARSGKSSFAQKLAFQAGERVLYVATARALDEEMTQRVERHQGERPAGWRTLEAPIQVGAAVRSSYTSEQSVILDCVTMLVTNLILDLCPDGDQISAAAEAQTTATIKTELDGLLACLQDTPATWIIVSNEVGMGLVPPYPLGRLFRDLLGWANQRLAEAADEVYLLVAGIPVPIGQYRLNDPGGNGMPPYARKP
jgi:adenosylcobinamide kinase / adenosylcobinamide-phosphate guanylyltransferase